MAKVKHLPWGRCWHAVHEGRCVKEHYCKHWFAHHIDQYGWCSCLCTPVEKPKEFKSWAAFNRMLKLRAQVEERKIVGMPTWTHWAANSPYYTDHAHKK